jgi:hypothetical protein
MQPGVVEVALRHVGSIRDFARDPDRLTAADRSLSRGTRRRFRS